MKIYTYEELAALSNMDLDILVAKAQGARIEHPEGWTAAACYLPGVSDIIPRMKVYADGSERTEEELWESLSHALEFRHPSTDARAAILLLDDLANVPEPYVASHTVIDAYKDLSVVSSTGWGMTTQPKVVGKPSEALPRAITIAWLLMKQMQSIPFKQGDAILHDGKRLHFENIDPDDPTVAWATDEDGEDYELKTAQLQKA